MHMALAEGFIQLRNWFKAPRIRSEEDLAAFLNAQAAFVSQKSIVSYCQMKTRLHMADLLKDRPFVVAYERARWETFEAVLGDLVLIVEGYLRARVPGEAQDGAVRALLRVFRSVLDRHGPPAHRAEDWGGAVERFKRRLVQARLAAPLASEAISTHSAKRAFEVLPIHPDLRLQDADSFERSIQFLIVAAIERLERRTVWEALIRSMAAG
jgi:hypothetical protein